MREGDPAQEMFIIEEGEVTVEVNEIPQEPHLTKVNYPTEIHNAFIPLQDKYLESFD